MFRFSETENKGLGRRLSRFAYYCIWKVVHHLHSKLRLQMQNVIRRNKIQGQSISRGDSNVCRQFAAH